MLKFHVFKGMAFPDFTTLDPVKPARKPNYYVLAVQPAEGIGDNPLKLIEVTYFDFKLFRQPPPGALAYVGRASDATYHIATREDCKLTYLKELLLDWRYEVLNGNYLGSERK